MTDPELPAGAEPGELVAAFDRDEVTATRHAVAVWAAGAGLLGPRLEGFVLAVNEIVTNAVRHGGGRGRLRLWSATGTLWCEVHDPGTLDGGAKLDGHTLPDDSSTGGRGLWLARHLCDTLTFDTAVGGTTVRLAIALVPDPA